MKTVFIPIAVFKPSGHDVTNETRMKRIKIRNLHLVNSAFSRQVGSFANSEKKESAALTNEESKRGESGEMGRLISGSVQFHIKIWMYLVYVGTPCTIRRFSYSSEICSVNDHDVLLLFFLEYRFRIQVRVRPNFLSTYDIPTTTLQRAAAVIDVLADKNPTSSQEPSGRKLCRRVYILPINH